MVLLDLRVGHGSCGLCCLEVFLDLPVVWSTGRAVLGTVSIHWSQSLNATGLEQIAATLQCVETLVPKCCLKNGYGTTTGF